MSALWMEDGITTDAAPTNSASFKIERETHKLEKRLCRQMGQAIIDFNMVHYRSPRSI